MLYVKFAVTLRSPWTLSSSVNIVVVCTELTCKDSFVCLLFSYAIATEFQLYHGSDMMYEMRRTKPEATLLPNQGICNPLPSHHIDME